MPFLFPNFLRKYANIITLSGLMSPSGPLRKKYSFKWDYSNSFPGQQLHCRLAAHVAMDVSKMTEVFGQRNKEALDTQGKKHFGVHLRAAALSYLTRCQFPCFRSASAVIFAPCADERSFSNSKFASLCCAAVTEN